jgi:hypothetical protein
MIKPDKLNERTSSHGALEPRQDMVSGVIAVSPPFLCFLGMVGDHVPDRFWKQFSFRWQE